MNGRMETTVSRNRDVEGGKLRKQVRHQTDPLKQFFPQYLVAQDPNFTLKIREQAIPAHAKHASTDNPKNISLLSSDFQTCVRRFLFLALCHAQAAVGVPSSPSPPRRKLHQVCLPGA